MSKKLAKKIESQLDKLSQLLDNIDEVRIIQPDEPDTWDSDTLYSLVEQLKTALQLLEDQRIKGKFDEFGQPLTEAGLCSLMDDYLENDEEEYE